MEKERKRKSKDAKAASENLAVVAEKTKEGTEDEGLKKGQESELEPEPATEEPFVGPVPLPLETEAGKGTAVEADEEDDEEEEEEEEEQEEEEEEEEEEREEHAAPILPAGPPVLGKIPHVASYSAESKLQPQSEDVERIAPGFIPTTDMTPINASQADFSIHAAEDSTAKTEATEDDKLDKYVTAESVEQPAAGSKAEEIARRVFSAPVEDTSAAPDADIPEDIEESADTTADVETAPVVGTESQVVPANIGIGATKPPAESAPTTQEPAKIEPESSKPTGDLFPPMKTSTVTSQPDKPVADRIAPPVVAAAPTAAQAPATTATTETTVSGPSKSSKEKESGSVAGWLKSKFSRRSSKPAKPESPSSSGPSTLTKAAPGEKKSSEKKAPEKMKDVVPVVGPAGTMVLTEPKGAYSSDVGDNSVREVAMAGKDTKDTAMTGANSTTPPVVSPLPDDVPIAPTSGAAHHQRESSEISSLSSDEDTRGRSSVRLADTLGLPTNEPQGHTSEAHQQPTNKRAGMVVPDMPSSVGQSSTSGGEFEEAKDTIDDEDGLSPPPAVLPGAEEGRKSSSPARDSRFVEAL